MIFNKSKNILTIGTDTNGKGGIAILLQSYSNMFKDFNFIASHREGNRLKKTISAMSAILQCCYYCLFKPIHIVHIHTASFTDFYRQSIFVFCAKLFRKKVILHIHGAKFEQFYEQHQSFVRVVCRKADILVTVSNYFVNYLKEKKLNDSIFLLPNVTCKPAISTTEKQDRKFHLLFIGAIDNRKGIFDVLMCLAENKEKLQDKIIYHIGGTGDIKTMNEIIQQHQLTAFVRYHGWVDNEKKEKLFQTADIFVHPSIFESFGISILEAMSYHLPIIATPVGGITDLVENNVNGILVEPGNRKQLFESILFLIDHPKHLVQMGDQSGKKAEKFYPPSIEKQLNLLYQTVDDNQTSSKQTHY